MKLILAMSLLLVSTLSAASCYKEAENIAWEAVKIFHVNDTDIHCSAVGELEKLDELIVTTVMPPRYAYNASFKFPCGPQPARPVVSFVLNKDCKISGLTVKGFGL